MQLTRRPMGLRRKCFLTEASLGSVEQNCYVIWHGACTLGGAASGPDVGRINVVPGKKLQGPLSTAKSGKLQNLQTACRIKSTSLSRSSCLHL